MRGRGLKQVREKHRDRHRAVAPHAGAWIETFSPQVLGLRSWSPLMRGRGLKHLYRHQSMGYPRSPLMRGRGLKPLLFPNRRFLGQSPLMRGRGLKQRSRPQQGLRQWSPLMRGRGLKLLRQVQTNPGFGSPLMRGRGLKHADHVPDSHYFVAPHAGAWIETPHPHHRAARAHRRPSCGGVD